MFNKKHEEKTSKKEYSVSNESVAELQRLAMAKWLVGEIYRFCYMGFAKDMQDLMGNIEAKSGISKDEVDVDWSTVFKDNKIFTMPKTVEKKEDSSTPKDA